MVHVGDIAADKRIDHPQEATKVGQVVKARIEDGIGARAEQVRSFRIVKPDAAAKKIEVDLA